MTKWTPRILGALVLGLGVSLSLGVGMSATGRQPSPAQAAPAGAAGAANSAMPVAAQNALVQHYCVGCHDDLQMTGGLSLEHFDAAHPNPTVIGMMVGKLKAGAMPPKNMPRPSTGTLYAFVQALSAEGVSGPAGHAAAAKQAPSIPHLAAGMHPQLVDFAHKGDAMTVQAQNTMVHTICTQCHIDAIKPGGVSFQHFNMAKAPQDAQLAEKMIAKLRAGMMPPATAPKRPDQASIHAFVVSLENRIDRAAALHPDPGFRLTSRLNRAQYAASVRSALGLNVDVSQWLPPDTVSHNFDNISAVQGFSPTVVQSYLEAASEISRLAVGDLDATPSTATFDTSKFRSQMHHIAGTPMGTRGGMSIDYIFPADGTYRFQLLFARTPIGDLYGLTTVGQEIEVAINGQRVALLKINPKMSELDPHGLTLETPPIEVHAGPQVVSAAFVQMSDAPIDDLISPQNYTLSDTFIGEAQGITTLVHLRTLTITGPLRVTGVSNTISRQKIFICRPVSPVQEVPCARKIVTHLAGQFYRRRATPDEIGQLMHFYTMGRKSGDFETGIRMALQAMLVSTHFLFRIEPRPMAVRAGENYRVDDMDLASRLSYFLWAAPPDATLIKLAQEHRLHEPAVLDAQVNRMLKDPRSFALATRFAYQWLRLQDVSKVHPDALMYPMYDQQIEQAMIKETELFFDSIVKGNKNVLDLLTADYTYVNQDLAEYYGIPNVAGAQFRKVSLEGTHRRGILGEGSILVETSVADRSDPVLRGKWVLEVLLGQPPPPPPPGVNTNLSTSSPGVQNGRPLSVRERMALHRSNPVCASCHGIIDPIGLALENFGPGGHWRIRDNGVSVDASTTLYDGTRMDGLTGLDQALLKHQDTFLRVFTQNLMAYALGRQVQYFDMPTVRAIIHRAALNGNRFSSFIIGVVNSDAFRMSRAGTLSASNSQPTHKAGKKGF